jgi:hypothetical protein
MRKKVGGSLPFTNLDRQGRETEETRENTTKKT